MKNTKILVIGQTPPPYHGQAIMTQRLIEADLDHVKIYHLRLFFSKSWKSVGKFEVGKIFHLLTVVGKAILYKFKYNINILYHMPSGPNLVPVFRDIFMLFFLRLFFTKVIFHFRAAGLSEYIASQSSPVKWIAKRIYDSPDLAIHLSSYNPEDGKYFKAKKNIVIPDGLEDSALPYLPILRKPKETIDVLFVGSICESKGVSVLLEAIKKLYDAGCRVKLSLIGDFPSEEFQVKTHRYCQQASISSLVHFAGVKVGNDKWQYFLNADIFCFPSFYESESFGNVVVEAMMFELPVVSTQWRGIPSIVDDGKTGLLIPIQNHSKTAEALRTLVEDVDLRIRMGKEGRKKYLSYFQLGSFLSNMKSAFQQV